MNLPNSGNALVIFGTYRCIYIYINTCIIAIYIHIYIKKYTHTYIKFKGHDIHDGVADASPGRACCFIYLKIYRKYRNMDPWLCKTQTTRSFWTRKDVSSFFLVKYLREPNYCPTAPLCRKGGERFENLQLRNVGFQNLTL